MSPTSQMPASMVRKIIEIIIKSWNGTLEKVHQDGIRDNPEVAEAMFCEDNQYTAAQVVFQVSTFVPPPGLTKQQAIKKAKQIVKPN